MTSSPASGDFVYEFLTQDTSDARRNANAFGLLGMRERAARLGGAIRIKTAPNQGFALTVALPLAAVETMEG